MKNNTIYFSMHLKTTHSNIYKSLKSIIIKHGYGIKLLKNTKDIWIRDFMPLCYHDKFLEYIYNPDYLKENRNYQTDARLPIEELGLETQKIDIVLDGGNLITYDDTLIMIDKIFKENQDLTIENVYDKFPFFKKIVILPKDINDPYGHADGMVRFIDKNHILVNDTYDKKFKDTIHTILKKSGFKTTKLKLKENTKNAWGYINFLQIGNLIIQPSIDKVNDAYVKQQLESLYVNSIVELSPAKPLIKKGGVFNCISWETSVKC